MAEEERAMERTEKPTPKRRREAREKGRVAKSMEVNSTLMLLAGFLLLQACMGYLLGGLKEVFSFLLSSAPDSQGRLGDYFLFCLVRFYRLLLPVFTVTVLAALAANAGQVGFQISPSVLAPSWERLNPVEGFKRILGKRGLVELVKGLAKILLVGAVAYATFHSRLDELIRFTFLPPDTILPASVQLAAAFLMRAVIVLAVLALFDYGYQRWEFERSIMMTKQEFKEELKESEGDPLVKGKIRSIQQQISRRRMMEDVKKADVVVTNPTHYAVALGYEQTDQAPKVLAKGKGDLAARIKAVAEEARVPVVEKPLLARLLYQECEVGGFIPAALYEAVAELLAFVYSLRNKKKRR